MCGETSTHFLRGSFPMAIVHTAEGDDDMPAHVRSVLTATSIGIPIADGQLVLGTWQGLFLWEHRAQAHSRRLTVSVIGE